MLIHPLLYMITIQKYILLRWNVPMGLLFLKKNVIASKPSININININLLINIIEHPHSQRGGLPKWLPVGGNIGCKDDQVPPW